MAARVLAAVALVVVLGPGAARAAETVDVFTIKGAHGIIMIPENWNGGLFIYAHGYSADRRILQPFPADVTIGNYVAKVDTLFQAAVIPTLYGYASATTTYRSVGWYVKDAVKDVENVRRRFVKRHGKPTHTYLWGHSGGGMVTSTVIEYFPDTYDGAMPMCGPTAGARRNFNGALDIRVVYEWVCRDVPEARFACGVCADRRTSCVVDADCPDGMACSGRETPAPPELGLSAACTGFLLDHPERWAASSIDLGGSFVNDPVEACFGDLDGDGRPAPSPTPEQAARRDLFLRATQIPESFILTDMFFATIGMGEVVHVRNGGRHPWGNMDVTYTSPLLTDGERKALNAAVPRTVERRAATRYMRRWYEPRGRTRAKVLTIHALDDGLVIPENEHFYRTVFAVAGRADQLVQLHTSAGGHCGFVVELFPAFGALTAWVERDERPDPAALAAACPSCAFTDVLPGPMGTRVVERRQKGTPLRTFRCGGDPLECPADTLCAIAKQRCR